MFEGFKLKLKKYFRIKGRSQDLDEKSLVIAIEQMLRTPFEKRDSAFQNNLINLVYVLKSEFPESYHKLKSNIERIIDNHEHKVKTQKMVIEESPKKPSDEV